MKMKYSCSKKPLCTLVTLTLTLTLLISFLLPHYASALPLQSDDISVSAESAILIGADDKSVIFQKNAHKRMGMASTTKIMTALVVTELLPLDKTVVVPHEAVGIEGSSVYLTEGELLTVRDLLFALLLASANDAAVALAISASGSIEAFAHRMNEKASELGLSETNFTNPHGLYDSEHYTTAHDLAIIAATAIREPTIRKISSAKNASIPQGATAERPNGVSSRYLKNHNKLLSLYSGAIGLKTGYTKLTGRCLVSAAERDELTLIAVTLNAPDDWNDHIAMLDLGYSLYERVTLFDVGDFTAQYAITGGNESFVTLANSKPVTMTLQKAGKSVACQVTAFHHFELAPVAKDDVLAQLTVTVGEKSVISPLVAVHSVERTKKK